MSTTLPLFWNLSSNSKQERLDASVKLVSALEQFQADFEAAEPPESTSEDDDSSPQEEPKKNEFDALNAQDVSYSIRRLVRGLASPRESSRLGFAVALTELLSRINTVTCAQVTAFIFDSAKIQGSMTGQEERDALFARLFGLTAIIQSGLLVRDTPLASSGSSAPAASDLNSCLDVVSQLVALGEKKSWLRESAWWTLKLAIEAIGNSDVPWKEDALKSIFGTLFSDNKSWTPEKVALIPLMQTLYPQADWNKVLSPTFKQGELLHPTNYHTLARILKDVGIDEEDADMKAATGSWNPKVHFLWDLFLDDLLSDTESKKSCKGTFPEFFRILVDESLFASSSSPERKYWGFQIVQKALPRVSATELPMLFTKNFMRSWINHLSHSDRYLHKIAKQVASDIQGLVKDNPRLGFTLILQLTGVHGSHQFDKLTKTKTVETILTSMDNDGIQSYIEYLLGQVNEEQGTKLPEVEVINARRIWVVDQLAALVRNGAIPKDDEWVQAILNWLAVHGLFLVRKKHEKSGLLALQTVPSPQFSDDLRNHCRKKLQSCLAELTNHVSVVKIDDRSVKVAAVASDGRFWISRVLASIASLETDSKHATFLGDIGDDEKALREKARRLSDRLGKISGDQRDAAKGAELLLSATLLYCYCADSSDDGNDAESVLESCIEGATRMFPVEEKKSKKSRKSAAAPKEEDAPEPVDILVDNVIGFLEEGTAYMRSIANQVFSLLSGVVQESTIDLIIAQLERRDPTELAQDEDEDEDMEGEDGNEDEDAGETSSDDSIAEDDEEDILEDPELRRKIEEALRVNGVQAATGESDDESEEELMDDEQMLAIDEQLAAAFRARAEEKKGKGVDAQREATHYKNRVLDLVDTYIKKQPTSPFIIRLILPLIDLIVSTSSDEKQLSDKATGLLRARIGKSKDLPSQVDTEQVTTVLEEIHSRARKAPTSDILITLGQCSLYLSKALLHAGEEQPVVKVYRESLEDFVSRKASRLNTAFIQDFIRRHPHAAWNLRNDLTGVFGSSINGYRQAQLFQLLHTMSGQLSTLEIPQPELRTFMESLCRSSLSALDGACNDGFMSSAHLKEVLKVAQSAVRQTKRSFTTKEVSDIWQPSNWEEASKRLASSETLKSAAGLQTMCKQIAQIAGQESKQSKKKNSDGKRKADEADEKQDDAEKRPKRKKVKKGKEATA